MYIYVKCTHVDICTKDTVAEWLRRPTRNRLGLSRVGSSPASVEEMCFDILTIQYFFYISS